MSIIKNEIPILEFDTEQTAVINPTHERIDLKLPKKCVFAFLGGYIDEYANKTETRKVSEFVSVTKLYPIYITKYKGEEIVLCQAPVGAAPAAQILDWLIGYGVREIISAGSCGALEKFPESIFLVRMILYTADSLADVDKYDERNWGGNAYEYALTLCLDAVLKL